MLIPKIYGEKAIDGKIDTTKCKKYMVGRFKFCKGTDMIMTFSNIPKEAIKLQNDI